MLNAECCGVRLIVSCERPAIGRLLLAIGYRLSAAECWVLNGPLMLSAEWWRPSDGQTVVGLMVRAGPLRSVQETRSGRHSIDTACRREGARSGGDFVGKALGQGPSTPGGRTTVARCFNTWKNRPQTQAARRADGLRRVPWPSSTKSSAAMQKTIQAATPEMPPTPTGSRSPFLTCSPAHLLSSGAGGGRIRLAPRSAAVEPVDGPCGS